MNQNEIRYVGVDGCPYGWFAVGFTQDGRCEWDAFHEFEELFCRYTGAELILVDIPIGLPNGPEERRCDIQARAAMLNQTRANLGSRVFRTPTRKAVEYLAQNPDYGDVAEAVQRRLVEAVQHELCRAVQPTIAQGVEDEAIKALRYAFTKAIQREITGRSLSVQTLEIMLKIAQVDHLLPRYEPPYIREVHPEICFWALNERNAIVSSKSTQVGIGDRIARLNRAGVPTERIEEISAETWAAFPRSQVGQDDILDALAAAVTAYRGWPDNLPTLPGPARNGEENLPTQDPQTGSPMEMVFWEPPPPNEE